MSKTETIKLGKTEPSGRDWLRLAGYMAVTFVVIAVEVWWVGPSLAESVLAGTTGDIEAQASNIIVGLVVGTGVLVALVGSLMRVVAHGVDSDRYRAMDLQGKLCAFSATLFALIGAMQFLNAATAQAVTLVAGLLTALVLLVLPAVAWAKRSPAGRR